ncbi:hypothetical protein [Clostridium sp. UBA6640]|uniref:hypothetical protein n=1 Tax=Clostridium sp. UBA6640 TaxID=1946370 RepID=UPI0025C00C0F|nr:hypothetical protein [Clostridium sp. UBA6640]
MEFNLKINDDQALEILKVVHEKYMHAKVYFKEHPKEEDRIGVTTPEELKIIHNNILKQLHDKDLFKVLEIIN